MKTQRVSSLEARRLRTRFSPKSRIGQGLVSMAPWMDVVLLMLLFFLLQSKLVLQPGIVVELPSAPFTEGSRPGLVAVILSVGSGQRAERQDVVFFDDERFLVGQNDELDGLKNAFRGSLKQHADDVLILQIDQHVPHGTVQRVVRVARDAGIARVNVATRASR